MRIIRKLCVILKDLSEKIKDPLKKFMPSVKSINLHTDSGLQKNKMLYNSLVVDIDDGVKTSLSQKGDGVKSLTTMALLCKTYAKDRIIIIDEPEVYLHPDAVRYLRNVLFELAEKNQLVISTHSPILINRNSIGSNIIVDKNKAIPANRLDEIRKVLGIHVSDNLMYSDFVVIVEGPSDKVVIEKYLMNDKELKPLLENNMVIVRSIGGVNNLPSEIYNLEQYMCNYIALLDNDAPAREKAKYVCDKLNLPPNKIRYFSIYGIRKDSELEDLYDADMYKEYLHEKFGIDINTNEFKNKSKRWSDRIRRIAENSGIDLEKNHIDDMKADISNMISNDDDIEKYLNLGAKKLLENIKKDIKSMIEQVYR